MSSERVDKQWQKKGLEGYSIGAILGTLAHYGVKLDEGGFRELAKEHFPLAMAERWHEAWKGTGQFSTFPAAAADELWRRLEAERLAPSELGLGLAQLVSALELMRRGSPEAPVGERFKRFQELKAKIPLEDGKPLERFVAEVVFHLGDWWRGFNRLAEELAKEGHVEDAEEFAEVEEFLFPERRGTVKALVRATKGEKEPAIADLLALATQADRPLQARLPAADALLRLEALAQAQGALQAIFDEAEKAKDYHLGLEAAERLDHVLKITAPARERLEFLKRAEAMVRAHEEAHPHHHHH